MTAVAWHLLRGLGAAVLVAAALLRHAGPSWAALLLLPAALAAKLPAVTPEPVSAVPLMLPPFTVVCSAPRKAAEPAAPVFSMTKCAVWPAVTMMVSVPFTSCTVVPSTPTTLSCVLWPSMVPLTPASGL